MSVARALLAVLMIALAGANGQAAVQQSYPSTTLVDNVPAQIDGDAALAGVQVFLPAGLDRQNGMQNGYAALLGEIVAQTPVQSGGIQTTLRDAVAALGANLTVSVQPQSIRYYVEGPPSALPPALALLGTALASPDFSRETLTKAKGALRLRIREADQSPFGVVSNMLRAAYYQGSGAGFSPMGSEAVVAGATVDSLRRFWSDNYRSGGASLSAVGRVDENVVRAAQAAVSKLPEGAPPPVVLKAHKPTDPPARIITHRDVGVPWIGIGYSAPDIGSKDFATMLVVQAIIASLGRTDAIVSRPAALRPINAVYQYDVQPANFIIYSTGNSFGSPTGLREIFAATELLTSKPLDASVLERYRTLAAGAFMLENMTLEDRSALVGLTARLGLDSNYTNAVLSGISAVSPADVQRVVKAYLQDYTVAIVLPRATQQEER